MEPAKTPTIHHLLEDFTSHDGQRTLVEKTVVGPFTANKYTNDIWTARQRQASSIHEISYRACFKPQLPRFFIQSLSCPGDSVYDPFSGRGTTVIEAGICGRRIIANDINPLSTLLALPRFFPPTLEDVSERLAMIPRDGERADIDLSMFYHPDTEREIVALREYLHQRKAQGREDAPDRWIAMVATNRLTGHSNGFFSVYTLPPNQAVSPESQNRINRKRHQEPAYRDTHTLILRKTKSLLSSLTPLEKSNLSEAGKTAQFLCRDARSTPGIPDASVQLTVTSPPFLDIVQYRSDNWLRCWFNGLDGNAIGTSITMSRTVEHWETVMRAVFTELFRITRTGGFVAFEVGEVRKKTVRLDEHVVPLGAAAGFSCVGI